MSMSMYKHMYMYMYMVALYLSIQHTCTHSLRIFLSSFSF